MMRKKYAIAGIARQTNMAPKAITQFIRDGLIVVDNDGLIDASIISVINEERSPYIDLCQYITEMDRNSKLKFNAFIRKKLLEYIQNNCFMQIKIVTKKECRFVKDDEILVPMADLTDENLAELELWTDMYRMNDMDKLTYLTGYFNESYPVLTESYVRYVEEEDKASDLTKLQCFDFLIKNCRNLKKDLDALNLAELTSLTECICKEGTMEMSRVINQYVNAIGDESKLKYVIKSVRKHRPKDIVSYSFDEFKAMALHVFNTTYWQKNDLINKALADKKSAEIWLFMAMHFVSGWRGTDIKRLPVLHLRPTVEEIRQALSGDKSIFTAITNEVETRINTSNYTPNKTSHHSFVPRLTLFIPEILREPFGIIYAIAMSHSPNIEPGNPFIASKNGHTVQKNFFGKDFIAIAGNFKSQSANKAYLKGIAISSEEGEIGTANGYLTAALARSHKIPYEELPEVTSVYLGSAPAFGTDLDLLSFALFQRGVGGFILKFLLDAVIGDHQQLSFSEETKLLTQLDITPKDVNDVAAVINKTKQTSYQLVSQLLNVASTTDIKKTLLRIANGDAMTPTQNLHCLKLALGEPCPYDQSKQCLGCQYEIISLRLIENIVSEVARHISIQKNDSDKNEVQKSNYILTHNLLPLLEEAVATFDQSVTKQNQIAEIIERGIEHATTLN